MCCACHANPPAAGGLCLVCLKDALDVRPTPPRRHGAAKGKFARQRTEPERPWPRPGAARGHYPKRG